MEITPKLAKINHEDSSPCNSVESSPSEFKVEKHTPKLSSSLRERLKRTRRSFVSPLSVAKRLCVDDVEEDGRHVPADSLDTARDHPGSAHRVDANRNDVRLGSEMSSGLDPEDFAQQLRKEVKEKTETLRRLKMVEMYRNKNDLTQLQTLIDKWRSCAQAALFELQSRIPVDGQKGSLSELIDLFGLDDGILHFDRTEEDFTI
ncbi:swi5-dependent recombination DNA repair protein 1 homolog [Menidia menidia]